MNPITKPVPPDSMHRRIGDSVSPANERIYDAVLALAVAVRLVDSLGLDIITVDARARGQQRIQIKGDPHGRLNSSTLTFASIDGDRHCRAERYGVEIVWVELGAGA